MDFLTGNGVLLLCFIAGSALVILEAFMPGFGVAGILGVVMEIIAIWWAWSYHGTVFALVVTLAALLLIGLAIFLSYRSAMKGRLSKSPLILRDSEEAGASGTAANELARWVGETGVTVSALRPAGMIELQGERVKASSGGEFIAKGTRVRVTGAEGDHVVIRAEQ